MRDETSRDCPTQPGPKPEAEPTKLLDKLGMKILKTSEYPQQITK